MLNHLETIIKTEYNNTNGIIIIKDQTCIYERYFNGISKVQATHITSVTKSILSLLIGIAIDKGLINSVNQKVIDFFPDYIKKRGEKTLDEVSIKDIMTMTAPYKFKSEPYTKVYSSEDWTKAALDLLGGKGPIGTFKYNTVGIQILSGILSYVSGKSLLEFAMDHLFIPLGINRPSTQSISDRTSYMSFVKYKGDNSWISDPSGHFTGGWGLALSIDDLSKIGQLLLNKGDWKGEQLVSSEWIEYSTRVLSRWEKIPYGLIWWIVDEESMSYAAIGDGGNIIYIDKEKSVSIIMTAAFKSRYKDRVALVKEHILPYL